MKVFLTVVVGIMVLAGQVFAEEQAVLKNEKDKVSYSIGVDIGARMKKQSIDVDMDILAKGLKDAYSGSKTLMTEQEVHETLAAYQKEMMAKQQERMKIMGEKNKKEGEAFLAANKKKEGVITLPSGFQYKAIKEGTGKTPKATDTVTVNYRGTLIDGTEFDSSYKRGQPATFRVNGVIAGWTEALQLMKEGSKWELFIPANLAYGERGAGAAIGPNAVLIFEVELISVKPAESGEKAPEK
ncbi:MAG TPA: FKBP-type peptidyl-prolyl cis-trans isomerase [Thermodesulfovibrionales bacterium]|nr:FKBP-type peptidyl-prolyl cis-trans isomerase [Thermodesulfovibrionales bacterium]